MGEEGVVVGGGLVAARIIAVDLFEQSRFGVVRAEWVMSSICEVACCGRGCRCLGRLLNVPSFGAELGNHVGGDAGGGAALADATEKGGDRDTNRCTNMDGEVG